MASATAPELTCPPPLPWPSRGSPDAFEFRLDVPVAMLPADELFSGGRLVPLQLAPPPPPPPAAEDVLSPELPDTPREETVGPSPRAPKCSSRWRELLGLKSKAAAAGGGGGSRAASRYTNPNPRSLKLFLRRDPKSNPADPSMSLSLLKDSDSESVSLSSRRSLSSSSSSSSGEDLPRLSLDAEKPNQIPILLSRNPHPPRVRVSRQRSETPERRPAARSSGSPARRSAEDGAAVPPRAAVDSPRMNASGRVVFQGLDRSSSSPGSFNGGPRVRNWAMERSYSAGVRVTPVLNVPAFGLGNLFRKEREGSSARSVAGAGAGVGSSKAKIERERASNN